MKIYISGNFVYLSPGSKKSNYDFAKYLLVEQGIDPENIVNLHDSALQIPSDFSVQLQFRFSLLDSCDSIYMLRNWKDSIESRHELTRAQQNGLKIYFENHQIQIQ